MADWPNMSTDVMVMVEQQHVSKIHRYSRIRLRTNMTYGDYGPKSRLLPPDSIEHAVSVVNIHDFNIAIT